MSQPAHSPSRIGIFLQLERTARHAASLETLFFSIVNETRHLLEYRQAVLAIAKEGKQMEVETVSGVAVLDRKAPFIQWMKKAMTVQAKREDCAKPHGVDPATLPENLRNSWSEWNAPFVLWCPLITARGSTLGALWLVRDKPWQESETLLLEQLADSYAHAWAALQDQRQTFAVVQVRRGLRWLLLLVLLVIILALPVQQSVLAPAEVVAHKPDVVAASMDGVIKTFAIFANKPVKKGDVLFRFDDTDLRSSMEVSERTLGIARAEYSQASQGQYNDPKAKARMAALQAQVAMREAELEFARRRLAKVSVRAERDGLAVLADPQMWIGRPVQTGERILEIADPNRVELRAFLAVQDLITLPANTKMQLFLDIDPLQAHFAHLTEAGYEAEVSAEGLLSYRLTGTFADNSTPFRIGLRGTVKIYGQSVPLAMYLFRRPLSVLRQTLGF